jgi:hypothetical protein
MGTTYVTITDGVTGEEPGFWMQDGMLALWLRLLALHLPEPNDLGEHKSTYLIRNDWMRATSVYFGGCIPHRMENAFATPENQHVVRSAIESLTTHLRQSDSPLDADTINLLGIDGRQYTNVQRSTLIDIANAFNDLFNGRINATAHSTDIMPGSKPYTEANAG